MSHPSIYLETVSPDNEVSAMAVLTELESLRTGGIQTVVWQDGLMTRAEIPIDHAISYLNQLIAESAQVEVRLVSTRRFDFFAKMDYELAEAIQMQAA